MRRSYHYLPIFITLLTLATTATFAQGVHIPGTGLVSPTLKAQIQLTGTGLSATPNPSVTPIQDQEKLRLFIQDQDRLLTQDRDKLELEQKNIYQDQDRTRLTTQTLIQAQQTISAIPSGVTTLAKQIQNTLSTTLRSEEQIKQRSTFIQFFFGGDKQAALQIQQVTTQNQERIRQLQQLLQNCQCSQEVKTTLQQQLQIMQQEQTRLQTLSQTELQKRGIFSWITG